MAHLNVPAIQSALKMVATLAKPFTDASGTKLDDKAIAILEFVAEHGDVILFLDFLLDEFANNPNVNVHAAMSAARDKVADQDLTG